MLFRVKFDLSALLMTVPMPVIDLPDVSVSVISFGML